MRKQIAGIALGLLLCAIAAPLPALAQDKVVNVKTPLDPWQARRAETHGILRRYGDPKLSPGELESVRGAFDARLTAAEKGTLTPLETMELFRVFYLPKSVKESKDKGAVVPYDLMLQMVATQATLGWYDALRFADASGRAEIATNEQFFLLPFGDLQSDFLRYIKAHPEPAAAAVRAGIQQARERIQGQKVAYDARWPASYGMLRMTCAMSNAQSCETPPARPASDWPGLLDEAAQRVASTYRAGPSPVVSK